MNKPYNIQNTNICNGIFHISFFKLLLINEGEKTRGETTHRANGIREETTRIRDCISLWLCILQVDSAITSVFRRDTDIKTQYIEKEYFGKLSKWRLITLKYFNTIPLCSFICFGRVSEIVGEIQRETIQIRSM